MSYIISKTIIVVTIERKPYLSKTRHLNTIKWNLF